MLPALPSPGRAGTISCLANGAVAEAFQTAADRSFDGELCGHRIGAPSIEVQQLLNIQEPILRQDVLPSGATFRMSARLLSVECEFGYGAMIFLVPTTLWGRYGRPSANALCPSSW